MNLCKFSSFLRCALLTGMVGAATLGAAAQAHWPQFRGPNGQGISANGKPPITFGPSSNVVWKAAVPPGHSSPCIWGERIFLMAIEEKKLETLALNRVTGRKLWQQSVSVEKLESCHPTSSPVASSPAADGERTYVYFGSFGLIAYSHDGKEAWQRPMPTPKNHYGTATSPILYGNALILVLDTDGGDSQILAVDRADGKTLWKQERSTFSAGWSTPMIWSQGGQEDLIVLGSTRLIAYDPKTGKQRWWVDGYPQETVGVPVAGEGLLFASSAAIGGRPNEKIDSAAAWKELIKFDRNSDGKLQLAEIPDDYSIVLRPELPKDHPGYAFPVPLKKAFDGLDGDHDGALTEKEWSDALSQFEKFSAPVLMAIRPGGKEDATKQNVAWQARRGIPEVPSPLVYQGSVYLVRDGGLLACFDAKDGAMRYQDRIGVGGQYCASPVAAAGRIYVASQSGTIVVLKAGESNLQILARNTLAEPIVATPAIVENTLVVRTREHLYAFGER